MFVYVQYLILVCPGLPHTNYCLFFSSSALPTKILTSSIMILWTTIIKEGNLFLLCEVFMYMSIIWAELIHSFKVSSCVIFVHCHQHHQERYVFSRDIIKFVPSTIPLTINIINQTSHLTGKT